MATVRAIYAKGVLTPLEPLDLEEGAEVSVAVEGGNGVRAEPAPAQRQGLAGIAEWITEMHKSMPADAWDDIPTDLAKNKKHYLYGHPKEEE